MVTIDFPLAIQEAQRVPYVTADEALELMKVQYQKLMNVLEALTPEEWLRPTACSEWRVREIAAHQAGGYASGTGYREMFRQLRAKRKPGQLPEDAINEFQVNERASRSPEQLLAELRATAPVAMEKWAYQFRLARLFSIPHPVMGRLPIQHVMWVIHSRDPWMHRLDICRATGRKFEPTPGQDERIVALVMLDVEQVLRKTLGDRAVAFSLTGIGSGAWKVGPGEPSVMIEMDALDFNIFASGRYSHEEAYQRARLSGDLNLAQQVLKNLLVIY